MNTKEAIYAAILREPDEDLHRLALADWIDENEAGYVTCHICGGKGGWMSMYHGSSPQYKTGCATCDSTGLEPDDRGFRARGIRWMVANPQNSWVCLCKGGSEVPCRCCKALGDEIKDIPRLRDVETPYVVRRGMVEEVRGDSTVLLDGYCKVCNGGRFLGQWDTPGNTCPAKCKGGRTRGVAALLFQTHPIKTVVLTDKHPEEAWWLWRDRDGTYARNRAYIPAEIFDAIPVPNAKGSHGIKFDSVKEASELLSAGIVAFYRKKVGLS